MNISGKEAIGDEDEGLLFTIRQVLQGTIDGNHAAIGAQIGELDTRLDELNAVRAKVGATYSRVEIAASRLAQYEGTALQLLNDTESTDLAKTMIEFSVHQAAMQAGLKAGASVVQNSLLDCLR